MKSHPLHSKADIHRASLLQLVPRFAGDIELAANGFHVHEWQLRWKVRLVPSSTDGDVLVSLYHGQGIVDLPRDMSRAQRGLEELDHRLGILHFFPGGVFSKFAKKQSKVGRPPITPIGRFHAFDPSLVILKYLCGMSWADARKWVQRKRYRYCTENTHQRISYDEVGQQNGSLKKRASVLKKELHPSHVALDDFLDRVKLPKRKGRYTDLEKPTAKDRKPTVVPSTPIDPHTLTFQTDWDHDETTYYVLKEALAEAQKRRKVPMLVAQALDQLSKVVKESEDEKRKSWKGHWPLSPVLPDALGLNRCFGTNLDVP